MYRQAAYYVVLEHEPLCLQIGRHDTALEQRLIEITGLRQQAYILTPCNPRSQQLDASRNQQRCRDLQAILQRQRVLHWPTLNVDGQGAWPDEPGFLLVDVATKRAIALARRFAQNAMVSIVPGQAPDLLWIDDGSAAAEPAAQARDGTTGIAGR